MKQKDIAVTYDQFAFGIGKQAGLLRTTSLVWHKEYVASDAEIKADYRKRWLTQHLQGNLDVTQQVAERILSNGKGTRNKAQQDAYYRAYSDFRYHIIRPVKKGSATGNQVDVVEQALAIVEAMTKAQQTKFFARVSRKK